LFWSLCYLVLRRLLQLAALRFRSDEFKELEIVVLRHELAVLDERSRRGARHHRHHGTTYALQPRLLAGKGGPSLGTS